MYDDQNPGATQLQGSHDPRKTKILLLKKCLKQKNTGANTKITVNRPSRKLRQSGTGTGTTASKTTLCLIG